jgi:signal transduction histidine kinase
MRIPLRFLLAFGGLLLGAFDVVLAHLLGVRFEWQGRDVSLLMWLYFGSSFSMLGYFIGTATEWRRREARLAAALRDQLAMFQDAQLRLARGEKLALLGQLAAAIAHEVRNPLAIIRSSIQNVAEALPDGDGASKESCRFAIEEIDRLTRVAGTLLGFVRPIQLDRAKSESRELLDRVELLSAGLLKRKNLRLQRRDPERPITLPVDRDLVCQALLGLIDNAVEVSPEGAALDLEVTAADGAVELAVADAGPGVPLVQSDRIFEPFFTTRAKGHGLGLAVVRQIAEAHGGKVLVGDRPGGGARFALRLPVEAA